MAVLPCGIQSDFPLGFTEWKTAMDMNLHMIDSQIFGAVGGVIGQVTSLPSGSLGDKYIMTPNTFAYFSTNGWETYPLKDGAMFYDTSANDVFVISGGTTQSLSSVIGSNLVLTPTQILNAIQLNPSIVFSGGSGATPPSTAPSDFPFYVDTATSSLYYYDYNTNTWIQTGVPHAVVSSGTSSSGVSPIGDANGLVDNSWLDTAGIAVILAPLLVPLLPTPTPTSVTGGTAGQSGTAPIGDASGLIDSSWIPAGAGLPVGSLNDGMYHDGTNWITKPSIQQSAGPADVDKFVRTDSTTGLLDNTLMECNGFIGLARVVTLSHAAWIQPEFQDVQGPNITPNAVLEELPGVSAGYFNRWKFGPEGQGFWSVQVQLSFPGTFPTNLGTYAGIQVVMQKSIDNGVSWTDYLSHWDNVDYTGVTAQYSGIAARIHRSFLGNAGEIIRFRLQHFNGNSINRTMSSIGGSMRNYLSLHFLGRRPA